MTRDNDPIDDPIGDYFDDAVDELADAIYREATVRNVLEETHEKRGIRGYGATSRISSGISSVFGSSGGGKIEKLAKRLYEETVDEVSETQTDEQEEAVLACAYEKHTDTLTEESYAAYEDAFVEGFEEWTGRLNPEAGERMEEQMRAGFENLTDTTAYFMQYEGETFEDRVAEAPEDEAREQLQGVVDYVVDIRDTLEACDEVYLEKSAPGLGKIWHFQGEGVRVFDEVVIPHVEEMAEEPFRGDDGDA